MPLLSGCGRSTYLEKRQDQHFGRCTPRRGSFPLRRPLETANHFPDVVFRFMSNVLIVHSQLLVCLQKLFCRQVARMPPFAAGDSSHSLNSFSDGALALMCVPESSFLRTLASSRQGQAQTVDVGFGSSSAGLAEVPQQQAFTLRHLTTFVSLHHLLHLPNSQTCCGPGALKNSSSRLPLCTRRPSQSPSFCQDFSPFQRGSFCHLAFCSLVPREVPKCHRL